MGRKNPNVSTILNDVHGRMIDRFAPTQANQEEAQAKIIQSFLQELKIRAFNRNPSNKAKNISETIYDMILDQIVLPNGRTLHNLFRRTGSNSYQQGMYFEDDFAAVVQSVLTLANPESKIKLKDVQLGADVGTTGAFIEDVMDQYKEAVKSTIIEDTQKTIEANKTPYVFGKIDTYIKGNVINLNGNIDFPPGLLEALSNATFTDKSYKSISWRNGEKVNLGDREIHLGNSDSYRAILGSMAALGFSKTTTEYVFFGGKNIVAGLDKDPEIEDSEYVKHHIWHLRYMYELTGAGIVYKDFGTDFFGGAKFLVYNDPSSTDIYVTSTKKIISDLLQSQKFPDNPYGAVGISTASIRARSK